MYSFVFLWTPALSPDGQRIPHGWIFACFMTASMAGSAGVGPLARRYRVESYMKAVFAIAAAALGLPCALLALTGKEFGSGDQGGITGQGRIILISFCVFEATVSSSSSSGGSRRGVVRVRVERDTQTDDDGWW